MLSIIYPIYFYLYLYHYNLIYHDEGATHVTDYHYGGYNAFSGGAKWEECPEGQVIGGFYRTGCSQLNCLSELTCVSPVASNLRISQTCQDIDLPVRQAGGSWGLYNVECPAGYLLRGIYHSDNYHGSCGIQCMRKFRCCQYDTSVIQVEGVTRFHEEVRYIRIYFSSVYDGIYIYIGVTLVVGLFRSSESM